jgi:hypothetical protein
MSMDDKGNRESTPIYYLLTNLKCRKDYLLDSHEGAIDKAKELGLDPEQYVVNKWEYPFPSNVLVNMRTRQVKRLKTNVEALAFMAEHHAYEDIFGPLAAVVPL